MSLRYKVAVAGRAHARLCHASSSVITIW